MVQMISESKRKIAALALAGAMAIGGAAGVATTIASPAQNQSGIVMEAEAAATSSCKNIYLMDGYTGTVTVTVDSGYKYNKSKSTVPSTTVTSVKQSGNKITVKVKGLGEGDRTVKIVATNGSKTESVSFKVWSYMDVHLDTGLTKAKALSGAWTDNIAKNTNVFFHVENGDADINHAANYPGYRYYIYDNKGNLLNDTSGDKNRWKAGVADNWFYYKFTKAGKYTIKVRMGCQSSSETPAIVETLTIV